MYKVNLCNKSWVGPFFKSQLTDDLEKSGIHIFSFDYSLNDVTQTSEIDLYVRYWDVNASQGKSRYYGLSFLSHATHKVLLKQFGIHSMQGGTATTRHGVT